MIAYIDTCCEHFSMFSPVGVINFYPYYYIPTRLPLHSLQQQNTYLTNYSAKPAVSSSSDDFSVLLLNTQSCRNKVNDLNDLITEGGYDLVFLTETWLKPLGDETDIVALTPPGYSMKSVPRINGTGGGLAVIFKNALGPCVTVSCNDFSYTSFEICETRLSFKNTFFTFFVYIPSSP